MKLLFDQNLSHRLVKALAAEFPESAHIRHIGMDQASEWTSLGLRKGEWIRDCFEGL